MELWWLVPQSHQLSLGRKRHVVLVTNWDLVGGVLTDNAETGERYSLGCPWGGKG
jgi:hypothetical protein